MIDQQMLLELHDAELVSVEIRSNEKKLFLGFKRESGDNVKLTFEGVESYKLNDIINQNVISRLIVSNYSAFSDEEAFYWVKWIHRLGSSDERINENAIINYVNRIANKDLQLVVLEPSWGAEGAVICQSVGLRNRKGDVSI